MANENKDNNEQIMNKNLYTTVQNLYKEIAFNFNRCNKRCSEWATFRYISQYTLWDTPYHRSSMTEQNQSLNKAIECLRAFSSVELPKLARKFDPLPKNDMDALVKDFVQAMNLHSSGLLNYKFEEDDNMLISSHLRRLAIHLDLELDRITKEIDEDNANFARGKEKIIARRVRKPKTPLAICLEPELIMDNEKKLVKPIWPIELALDRLREGRSCF